MVVFYFLYLDMLNLMEELLLLALDDKKGKVLLSSSTELPYALRGAVLLELVIAKKIDIVNKKVVIIDSTMTGNPILNNALELIENKSKEKSIGYWISRLGYKMKSLRKDLLSGLMDKGILEKVDGKILWLIPTKKYPTKNPIPENEVRKRLIDIVLHDNHPDERSLMLISLVNSCKLVKEIFSKESRREAKKKIKEIVKNESFGKEVTSQVNNEIMSAITAQIVSMSVASSRSTS